MPRGQKATINYDEELSRIDAKIIRHKASISELQEQRKTLLEKHEKDEMYALYQAILESGKSVKDVIANILPKAQKQESD